MTDQSVTVVLSTKRPGECRSCKVPVTWYKTQAGKWKPFTGDPPVSVQGGLLEAAAMWGEIHASHSHFVTCPDADAWRK